MKIEVGKTYLTYSGAKVRIYAIDGLGKYSVHGAYWTGVGWESTEWTFEGSSIYDVSEDIVSEWKSEDVWTIPVKLGPEHGFTYSQDDMLDALQYSIGTVVENTGYEGPKFEMISSPYVPENSLWFLPPSSYDDWHKQKWEIKQKLNEAMIYGGSALKVTWDKAIQESYVVSNINASMCNCGGKIDTHKADCPENKEEKTVELQPFYYYDDLPDRYLGMNHKKCECGSDSLGSPKHSDYCPKFKAD